MNRDKGRKIWTIKEDNALTLLVKEFGTKHWTKIARKLSERYNIVGKSGKKCRERWHNNISPDIKKGPLSQKEEEILLKAHENLGNKWAEISKLLPGRSDNCIKNYFYSDLRKKIRKIKEENVRSESNDFDPLKDGLSKKRKKYEINEEIDRTKDKRQKIKKMGYLCSEFIIFLQ